MDTVQVIICYESDGSGTPEVLRVLRSTDRANSDVAMLEKALAAKRVMLVEAEFDEQE